MTNLYKLDDRVQTHLALVFPYGCSRRELARSMKMEASTMSGCINRLIKRERVEVAGTTVCTVTNKTVQKIQGKAQ